MVFAVAAACTTEVTLAELPESSANETSDVASGNGGSGSSGGSSGSVAAEGGATMVDPCDEALAEFGACMSLQDWQDNEIGLLAYQQTDSGPCGGCHQSGTSVGCLFLGFNDEEAFSKTSMSQCAIENFVSCEYDDQGQFVGLQANNALVEVVETANQTGSQHPAALVPAAIEQNINDFVQATLAKMEAGTCGS